MFLYSSPPPPGTDMHYLRAESEKQKPANDLPITRIIRVEISCVHIL